MVGQATRGRAADYRACGSRITIPSFALDSPRLATSPSHAQPHGTEGTAPAVEASPVTTHPPPWKIPAFHQSS
ncbi:hypothetical protein HYQ46_001191 [Verticillium longisporum]|nr:hypothetical protein HYQ46_001191 [Verticillium longisporum]